jgi:hypothetical protein
MKACVCARTSHRWPWRAYALTRAFANELTLKLGDGAAWGLHLEPRNHADIHRIAPGDRSQVFAGSPPLDGFGPLIVGKLAFAAELHTVGHSAIAASIVDSSRPCELPVSQSGSPSDRKDAPALPMRSIRSSSSRVDLPSRSSLWLPQRYPRPRATPSAWRAAAWSARVPLTFSR